jgi:hypothetical protein
MMKHILSIAFFLTVLLIGSEAAAQCAGGIAQAAITPTGAWQTVNTRAGRYRPFNATAGTTYQFSYCSGGGTATWDTELSINNNAGVFAGAYNDDACGFSSELSWLCPTTATYRILVNELPCAASASTATLAYRTFVPGPGATCGNPHIIPSLPFTATALTTCGAGNDYTAADACTSTYMNGEDYVFRYVATGAQTIRITLSNTLTFTGIFVVQGCPNTGGTCIPVSGTGCGGSTTPNLSAGGNPQADFALPGAGTYFFIVDTWPTPNCTGFDINVQQVVASGPVSPGCGAYTISTPTYAPDPFNSGTAVVFPDDKFSSAIGLPFTFCFMGTQYTSLIISSNAYVSFTTVCGGQDSNWDTDIIPSPAYANSPEAANSIMFPWVDVDPGVSGTIRYNTYGTAPNRRFVVAFRNVAMFDCNAMRYTGQVVLYETSFVIDMYIQSLPNCITWNNGEAVLGLLDATGTVAVPVPGFNNTVFTLTNFARRFTPNCPGCTILPIDFPSLTGDPLQDHNVITWSTAHETHSASFVLQRSRDGQQFETVGSVASAGSAPMGNSYSMDDYERFSPMTHYRVVHRDDNGLETYSQTIAVYSSAATFAILNAVPKGDQLQLDLQGTNAAQQIEVTLLDVVGKVIFVKTVALNAGAQRLLLDQGTLRPGVYFIRATDHQGNQQMRKFIWN